MFATNMQEKPSMTRQISAKSPALGLRKTHSRSTSAAREERIDPARVEDRFRSISISRFLVLAILGTLAVFGGAMAMAEIAAMAAAPKSQAGRAAEAAKPREAWTTSQVVGSPEPPPPYKTTPAFPNLKFKNPLLISNAPGIERLFVGEQAGKIFSFPNDSAVPAADLFFDPVELTSFPADGDVLGFAALYGLAFHPKFAENRYCYLCYACVPKTPGVEAPDGTRVSRFEVSRDDPPRIDPKSEQVIITWLSGGHNGGCLAFGPDGCLYISSGDAASPNPPDALHAGQDVTNLLSSILRIDVDHADEGRLYAIPQDNPFVDLPQARGEIWAYGFRNPWKMSFDRVSGELWVGDVGWELWELVHRIERGGNYGWSIMEGRQSVRPEGERGPTPIQPPAIDLPHSLAASVTGGFVYRGERLPKLKGRYIFGDWETRRVWAARFDREAVHELVELVAPTLRVVSFGEDNAGELYILDYDDGTIHFIEENDEKPNPRPFPRVLSDTGLFEDVASLSPAPGVIPYRVVVEPWADHSLAERWVALPEKSSVATHAQSVPVPGTIMAQAWDFPPGAVLVKTISLETERGNTASRRRVETQLLHFNGKLWNGYAYKWNDAQTDATLVGAEGETKELTIEDALAPGGKRTQTWTFAGRAACARCHNPWAQHALGFNRWQLARPIETEAGDFEVPSPPVSQLDRFVEIGLLAAASGESAPANLAPSPGLVDPSDASASLDARARSYLHANCAHCHQLGAGGTADIELRFEFPLDRTKTLAVRPAQGTFEIHDGRIVAPGDPYRSILYYRMSKLGRGRMPHIGSDMVDEQGSRLIHDWIAQLPSRPAEAALLATLRETLESTALARERDSRDSRLADLARARATAANRETPSDEDWRGAQEDDERGASERTQARVALRAETIDRLLSSTTSALLLARTIDDRNLETELADEAIAAAANRPEPQIRDLFERFLPEERRAKRLGAIVQVDRILALPGDAERGKAIFFATQGTTCKSCHKVGDQGGSVGPELTKIGGKHGRRQLLESILEPSKFIEPKFVTWMVETTRGQVHTGLLTEKTAKEVVLRNAKDQEIRVPAEEVDQLLPQRQSLMPELLLRDLTAEQVADLLEYLSGLK